MFQKFPNSLKFDPRKYAQIVQCVIVFVDVRITMKKFHLQNREPGSFSWLAP